MPGTQPLQLAHRPAVELAVAAFAQPPVLKQREPDPAKAISAVCTARRRSELKAA
ncbi:MAG: hypothetical protein DIU60_008480 [Actinomycetes bacterium]